MPTLHARSEILLGKEALAGLRQCHVLVAGIGGVGGYVAENLARAGIGSLTLLDKDVVSPSNINRQLVALQSTLGKPKTVVMQARIADIDPAVKVHLIEEFMSVETAEQIVLSASYDYIADCIDSIACKAQLVAEAQRHAVPIMSAMGAGNRIDVSKARISSLAATSGCPLAREMRRRLRALQADLNYPVVFSDEPRRQPLVANQDSSNYREKATNGTVSYLPAVFGVLLAGEIVRRLLLSSNQLSSNQ